MIRFRSPMTLTLLAIGLAATVAGFLSVPAEMNLPLHWGIDGRVDGTLPRNWALVQMPVVVLVLWALFWAIDRFSPSERREAAGSMMRVALVWSTAVLVLIQVLIVLAGLGIVVDSVRIVVIAMALTQVALGNVMPKSRPNAVAGIRLPSSLADPAKWQAVHRLSGVLSIVCGIALLAAAILIPVGPLLLGLLIIAWLMPLIAGSIYSVAIERPKARGV
jgi:uncharacterized membrane protein